MSTPTRFGRAPVYRLTRALGYDPGALTEDVPDPVDRALAGTWQRPRVVGAIEYVQHAVGGSANTESAMSATLAAAPTEGNLLVIWASTRTGSSTPGTSTPTGWNTLPSGETINGPDFDGGSSRMYWRIATAGMSATVTVGKTGAYYGRLMVAEFAGANGLDGSSYANDVSASTAISAGPHTPSTGINALLVAGVNQSARAATYTWDAPWTELSDSAVFSSGPCETSAYRIVTATSGSYTATATGTESDGYGWILAAFVGGGIAWDLAPFVHDDDDATYDLVEAAEADVVLRGYLEEPYRIGSARLRAAPGAAGAATYVLEGATVADFSDAVELGTFAWTAAGSYDPDDVTVALPGTSAYQYYRLLGSPDVRIHTIELFDVVTDWSAYQLRSEKGEPGGYAPLDGDGLVPYASLGTGGDGSGTNVLRDNGTWGTGGGGSLPWFVVTDYGATGDGTTDDRDAINDAIAALNSAGGGVLYFPAGNYLVTAGLTALTAVCTVLGDGASGSNTANFASKITCSSGSATLFDVQAHGVTFDSLALVGSAGTPTAGAGIAVTAGGDHGQFRNLKVRNFYVCVDVQEGAEWRMTGCHLEAPVLYALKIRHVDLPDGGDWSISDSWITADIRDSTTGIRIESGGGGKLSNVKINGRPGSPVWDFGEGIDVAIPTGIATSVLTIASCSIENVRGDAVKVTTTGTGQYGHIAISGLQVGLYGNSTGRAVNLIAASTGGVSVSGGLGNVVIDGLAAITNGTARAAVSLTNTDRVTLGDFALLGFNARYTSSGDTNTTDAVGEPIATAHIADTSDAHDASAISIADVGGYYTGTDVEAALQEIGAGGIGGSAGHYEVIVSGSAPPVAVTNEAEDDWLYGFVPD